MRPVFKRVDSCAAEFASHTAYMYSTYEEFCEADPTDRQKIMILGGGPNRIGQGIEFDYCCVHASFALKEAGFETIMVNCNPETVSTDYDTSDRLYFEPVTLEDVLEIVHKEKPKGVIVQYGGQTPLKLAAASRRPACRSSAPRRIRSISPRIASASSSSCNRLKLKQPPNRTARNVEAGRRNGQGGRLSARRAAVVRARRPRDGDRARRGRARATTWRAPSASRTTARCCWIVSWIVAVEVDVDAICDGKEVIIGGIMEHVEQAGIHSGDSGCSLPPFSLTRGDCSRRSASRCGKWRKALKVNGIMNTQFAIQNGVIYVLEVNPRASRTVPFVSKAIGMPLAKIAAQGDGGHQLRRAGRHGAAASGRIFRSRSRCFRSSSSRTRIRSSARK